MKNAITVIDQELIDDSKSTIKPDDDACDRARISVGTLKELILMCEDLIEINAELTAEKVKKDFFVKGLLTEINQTAGTGTIKASRFYKKLKGDSDE